MIFGDLVQLFFQAEMYNFDGFRYFLLVIDVFSNHIWTVPLKSKETNSVKNGFEEIFQK